MLLPADLNLSLDYSFNPPALVAVQPLDFTGTGTIRLTVESLDMASLDRVPLPTEPGADDEMDRIASQLTGEPVFDPAVSGYHPVTDFDFWMRSRRPGAADFQD